MNIAPEDLVPETLAPHYSRFRVSERLLLSGHSHQAWPDVAFDAQQRAWLDAAEWLDDKWGRAEEQAARVRAGFARLLGDRPENIALGENTHELVTRWLSALPLRSRPRMITTDGEFHTIRRQIDRLAEEGLPVEKVAARPADTLAERLAAALDARTACVLVSSVLFDTAEMVPNLGFLAGACDQHGVRLLVDAYHHLNVVPFDLDAMGLMNAFVTGGGYKYCQLGEGNAFMRVPDGVSMRPVLTGWFAEFAALEHRSDTTVQYPAGAAAFLGATYDPTSHYRAAAVFAFHERHHLTPTRLRALNQQQVAYLARKFAALDVDPSIARIEPIDAERRGGFLAIRSPRAADWAHAMRARGVFCDARGDVLRLGPAPYVREDQLSAGIGALADVIMTKQRHSG